MRTGRRPRSEEQFRAAFEDKTIPEPNSGCLLWSAGAFKDGYGQCFFRGKNDRAHRIAWRLNRGDIPAGLQVLHRCDTPACVRVDHLFLGTTQENTADKIAKGRQPRGSRVEPRSRARGERCGRAVLTETEVALVRTRRAAGALLREISAETGRPIATIHHVLSGRTWGHAS